MRTPERVRLASQLSEQLGDRLLIAGVARIANPRVEEDAELQAELGRKGYFLSRAARRRLQEDQMIESD